MRTVSRRIVLAASIFLLACATAVASDDPLVGNQNVSKNASPATDATGDSKPDSELESILQKWQELSSRVHRIDLNFHRIDYDEVFEVERRGTGHLSMDIQGRAMFQVIPEDVEAKARSGRKGRNGTPFQVQPGPTERWYWTSKTVIKIDDRDRTFERIDIPLEDQNTASYRSNNVHPDRPKPPALPENVPDRVMPVEDLSKQVAAKANDLDDAQSPEKASVHWISTESVSTLIMLNVIWSWSDSGTRSATTGRSFWNGFSCLIRFPDVYFKPLLLRVSADQLKARYHITLEKKTGSEVRLSFKPKLELDQADFKQVFLILNTDGYKPTAMKVMDPTGNHQTIYIFSEVETHRPATDRLQPPDLREYREKGMGGK